MGFEAVLKEITQLLNWSFIAGIVLGVFLKMILEAALKGILWLVRGRFQKAALSVLLDYACEVAPDRTIKPLEPHLVVANRTGEKLSISRIDIQYGQVRSRKIVKGLFLQSHRLLYSSPLVSEGISLEPKSELKIFLRPTRGDALEIADTKPFIQLRDTTLSLMPPEAMRYAALAGDKVIGKSEWFNRTSIRPTLK